MTSNIAGLSSFAGNDAGDRESGEWKPYQRNGDVPNSFEKYAGVRRTRWRSREILMAMMIKGQSMTRWMSSLFREKTAPTITETGKECLGR